MIRGEEPTKCYVTVPIVRNFPNGKVQILINFMTGVCKVLFGWEMGLGHIPQSPMFVGPWREPDPGVCICRVVFQRHDQFRVGEHMFGMPGGGVEICPVCAGTTDPRESKYFRTSYHTQTVDPWQNQETWNSSHVWESAWQPNWPLGEIPPPPGYPTPFCV